MGKRIEIPDSFMGVPVSEDTLKQSLENGPAPQVSVPVGNSAGVVRGDRPKYLLLEGRIHRDYEYPDLIVSTERTHNNSNWSEAWEKLRQNGEFMLTIRQYVDFFNMLKSGKGFDENGRAVGANVLEEVFEDITKVGRNWRAEWLDGKFSKIRRGKKAGIIPVNEMQIVYHVLDSGNGLKEITENLTNYLRGDKTPGIDMNEWLDGATYQGLPKEDISSGSLYYWHPRDSRVAWFGAGSVRAGLSCGGNPGYRDASLGVRAAREKK
jgi:hypothetical protein